METETLIRTTSFNRSPFINHELDRELYFRVVDIAGEEKAATIVPQTFARDFGWERWEVMQATLANTYVYKIIEVEGETRLVGVRDLEVFDENDILTKVRKDIRDGLEFAQMSNVRQRLLQAEINTSLAWVSPQKVRPEDPEYALSFIHFARKLDLETVAVTQSQRDYNLVGLAGILNRWVGKQIVNPDPSLEEIMSAVVEKQELLPSWDMSHEVGLEFIREGLAYIEAIKRGLAGGDLMEKHRELLKNTIDYKEFMKIHPNGTAFTSCGPISFGKLPSWVGESEGGLYCKKCKKGLSPASINSHRCVC